MLKCPVRQPILSGWHTGYWDLNLLEIAHSGGPDVPSVGLSAEPSNGPIEAWAGGLFPVLALARVRRAARAGRRASERVDKGTFGHVRQLDAVASRLLTATTSVR
ncbi:hypothetical protein IFM12275_16040 [Nocardia sputorum]|nr:hypothetical protein IFM12275_16040 [Nocardia sputorum]